MLKEKDGMYWPESDMVANAHADRAKYDAMYKQSVEDPDGFWGEHGRRIDWIKPFTKVKNTSFTPGNIDIRWFEDGTLNVSANCVDRHLETRGDQTAIIWEPDDPDAPSRFITYKELHSEVSQFANVLKGMGVEKGDRVVLYLPMIPEAAYAMLACARIGAIHSIVFAGFSPDALAARVNQCQGKVVITADEAPRGGRNTPLKTNADKAFTKVEGDVKMLVVQRTGGDVPMEAGRDHWYHELKADASADCPPEEMGAEDPLFILYTSGSTGQPKGVVHTTGGYLVFAAMTHEYVFDYHDGDIFWCTADVGWVTGHSYIVYGPLANGATTLMFEGVPTYPDAGRFWACCEKHKVNQFYTAPTAIRALMGQGTEFVEPYDLSDLKVLGTVGEPINPEAWMWYHRVIGGKRCPIVDTWWQTETGGIMITPLPGAVATKPGSATLAFPGVDAEVWDHDGDPVTPPDGGFLVLKKPWPGMLRGIWGDPKRYKETYWGKYGKAYFAGDGAHPDKDGYFWIMGRVDDVMNVSGHRIGTMEVESAIVSHAQVAESAVVGRPDDLTGTAVVAFVTPKGGVDAGPALAGELRDHVARQIGAIAKPADVRFTDALPKTRSGKIMRRLLRDIAAGRETVGDTSTLEDYSVLARLRESEEP